MTTPTVPVDPLDDAAKAAAHARALGKHERDQAFRKVEREKFTALAKDDFNGNLSTLHDIYDGALVDAVHFALMYEIAAMVEVMRKLPVDGLPAAYAFGGYQEGEFKLPAGETDVTTKDKILYHTFECAPASIILKALVHKKPSDLVPWEKAASIPMFKDAHRADGSFDQDKLKKMAAVIEAREERFLKGIFHKNGPWLIWFHPDPGAWVANWHLCRAFVRAFNCLPDSIRFGFSPYLFTIVTLDPSKATPPPPAPASATTTPAAAPVTTTPTLPQYPHDDQPL